MRTCSLILGIFATTQHITTNTAVKVNCHILGADRESQIVVKHLTPLPLKRRPSSWHRVQVHLTAFLQITGHGSNKSTITTTKNLNGKLRSRASNNSFRSF